MQELFSPVDIRQQVWRLARELKKQKHPFTHMVVILNGAFHFASDLLRAVQRDMELDFVQVASYQGEESKIISVTKGPSSTLEGKDVLLVDDIADTGKTLQYVIGQVCEARPRSLHTAVLVRRASCPFMPDYVGFTLNIADFILGYGMDLDGSYRHLPFIGVNE